MKSHRTLLPLLLWLTVAASLPGAIRYVNVNNLSPAPPYTSWADAATNIQDAVDAALAGDQILVTNGVYQAGGKAGLGRVVVKAFTAVISVNGPAFTVINGDGLERCALIENGTLLSGFTLTNGNTSGAGGGVAFATMFPDAVVSNCFITGNSAATGGGAASALVTGGIFPAGGTLSRCVLSNNSATGFQPGNPTIGIGGGTDNCKLISCVLSGNSGNWDGGGASASTLTNCLLVGNSSPGVGGAIWSTLINCTASGNVGNLAGGIYSCDVRNSIVYYNSEPNHFANRSTTNSCATPLPDIGSGNLTNAPLFVDTNDWANLRLQPGSPCIDAGDNASNASTVDLDGKERLVGGRVDMGAYEWIERPTRYVSLMSANPTPPYLSWSTAATNIQDAVDAASAGDQVLVTNGVYQTGARFKNSAPGYGSNRLSVTKAIRVESVNGPAVTSIVGYQVPVSTNGAGAVRCAYLSSGAVLAGFTLTNGATLFGTGGAGGGVCCESLSELVSNCVVVGNSADWSGGGSFRGTLQNCTLEGNSARTGGGAYSGMLNNCVLIQNTARFDGGGAYASPAEPRYPCRLTNCRISGNRANEGNGGGAYFATLINCTVTTNNALEGGGAWAGSLRNCVLIRNEAGNGAGVAGGSQALRASLFACTLARNRATGLPGLGAAAKDSRLSNCILWGNSPGNYAASCSLEYSCTTPTPVDGIGNIDVEPLFVDATIGNLRLQSNSPCINSGPRSSSGGIDLDGNPRVVGGAIDIGAYEFQSPSSTLSYAWAQQYGLPTDSSADDSDSDSDFANNWQEWIAGTVPVDAASALRLLVPTKDTSGITVRWQSVSNRIYRLERAADLGTENPFSLLSNNLVGQPGTTSYTDTNTFGSSQFFYRIGVQQ